MSKLFRFVAKQTRFLPGPAKALVKSDPIYKATAGKAAAAEQAAKNAAAQAAADRGTSPHVAARTRDFATRQESRVAAAEAAGAVRIDNDYDLLGRGELTVKKKGASRALLGTR